MASVPLGVTLFERSLARAEQDRALATQQRQQADQQRLQQTNLMTEMALKYGYHEDDQGQARQIASTKASLKEADLESKLTRQSAQFGHEAAMQSDRLKASTEENEKARTWKTSLQEDMQNWTGEQNDLNRIMAKYGMDTRAQSAKYGADAATTRNTDRIAAGPNSPEKAEDKKIDAAVKALLRQADTYRKTSPMDKAGGKEGIRKSDLAAEAARLVQARQMTIEEAQATLAKQMPGESGAIAKALKAARVEAELSSIPPALRNGDSAAAADAIDAELHK